MALDSRSSAPLIIFNVQCFWIEFQFIGWNLIQIPSNLKVPSSCICICIGSQGIRSAYSEIRGEPYTWGLIYLWQIKDDEVIKGLINCWPDTQIIRIKDKAIKMRLDFSFFSVLQVWVQLFPHLIPDKEAKIINKNYSSIATYSSNAWAIRLQKFLFRIRTLIQNQANGNVSNFRQINGLRWNRYLWIDRFRHRQDSNDKLDEDNLNKFNLKQI